jgi:phosphopantothenoylcysteine decarboxylase/phosphopantothenate--cysteine ligase
LFFCFCSAEARFRATVSPMSSRPPVGPAAPIEPALALAPAPLPSPSHAPVVALAVAGSVAAYKAAEIARALKKGGARVLPVMTRAATEFLGPLTLSGITGEKTVTDMFDPSFPGEMHVDLARRADVVVIAPATADVLARLAQGRADDLVTALAMCARGPVIAAPAMHPRMWSHPAVKRNVATLLADGRVELVGPEDGEVASGETGMGRMAAPETIAAVALARAGTADLRGLRIVVSAGPTVEDFDPVRYIGNRSTGKMGFAVAERAALRGADVTLVAGPVSLATPWGVRRIDVRSALAMRSALWEALGPDLDRADLLVMTAAVADYRPREENATKLKRSARPMVLDLVPNPDLLAEIGAARSYRLPVLVGFAVETDTDAHVIEAAQGKLLSKRVDMVVANHAGDSFGRDDNRATIVTKDGAEPFEILPKLALADRILDRAAALCRR